MFYKIKILFEKFYGEYDVKDDVFEYFDDNILRKFEQIE